mgnify:CR=1 FL=1
MNRSHVVPQNTTDFLPTQPKLVGEMYVGFLGGNLVFLKSDPIHMIFYKFKNDDKGQLNELCIAARFPNTVPKRVIIRLSVSVTFLIAGLENRSKQSRLRLWTKICLCVCMHFFFSVSPTSFSGRHRSCWRTVSVSKAS